jgi:hypothetical protein
LLSVRCRAQSCRSESIILVATKVSSRPITVLKGVGYFFFIGKLYPAPYLLNAWLYPKHVNLVPADPRQISEIAE